MAGGPVMVELLRGTVDEVMARVVSVRERLHRHPELSGEEKQTAAFLAAQGRELGLEVVEGIGGHGVLCCLDGGHDRCVALRADMDALPINEIRADGALCSEVAGVSHACGHDAHSAMLVGAMAVLAQLAEHLSCNVAFIFQPAEEITTGAAAMIRDGVLERCCPERIHALHVHPHLPGGVVGWRNGVMCAAADLFDVEIHGMGGHAARPHHCIDVVLVACQMIQALHLLPSRCVDPMHPAVLTIGRVEAGHAANVIPASASFSGTVRSLDGEVHETIRARMDRTIHTIAEQWGAEAHFTLDRAAPLLVNDAAATDRARALIGKWLPDVRLQEIAQPSMGGEDFSEFLRRVPGCLLRLGSGGSPETAYPLHHPRFAIDDATLRTGVQVLAALALE